jgi:hypothetical protein
MFQRKVCNPHIFRKLQVYINYVVLVTTIQAFLQASAPISVNDDDGKNNKNLG